MAEVETTRDGSVLTIALNRPEVFNAFNAALHAALADALDVAADPEVRAVVITGAGRGFCPGQDLTEFREVADDIRERLESAYHPNIRAIRALEKPVLAAVNGPTAGAGLSLAAACDLRIAADTASLVPGFVGIGLVPDSGGSYFIQRLLGTARAFVDDDEPEAGAAEAKDWGLVNDVVEADRLLAHVAEVAGVYASLPTKAIGMTKRLFDHAENATLDEQLELEAELQSAATKSADFREGVAAFPGEARAEVQRGLSSTRRSQSSASAIRSSVSIRGGRPPRSSRAIADCVVPVSSASSRCDSFCWARLDATSSAIWAKR